MNDLHWTNSGGHSFVAFSRKLDRSNSLEQKEDAVLDFTNESFNSQAQASAHSYSGVETEKTQHDFSRTSEKGFRLTITAHAMSIHGPFVSV